MKHRGKELHIARNHGGQVPSKKVVNRKLEIVEAYAKAWEAFRQARKLAKQACELGVTHEALTKALVAFCFRTKLPAQQKWLNNAVEEVANEITECRQRTFPTPGLCRELERLKGMCVELRDVILPNLPEPVRRK